jgi:hypothetical protein
MILLDNAQAAGLELNLAKETADILHTTYPGNLWAVSVEGPRVMVRNLALAGNWGYVRYIPAIYSASDWKKQVLQDGGELLERYEMSRNPMSFLDTLLAAAALPVDHAGNHKPSM